MERGRERMMEEDDVKIVWAENTLQNSSQVML